MCEHLLLSFTRALSEIDPHPDTVSGEQLRTLRCDFVDRPQRQHKLLPTSQLCEGAKGRVNQCMMEWEGLK